MKKVTIKEIASIIILLLVVGVAVYFGISFNNTEEQDSDFHEDYNNGVVNIFDTVFCSTENSYECISLNKTYENNVFTLSVYEEKYDGINGDDYFTLDLTLNSDTVQTCYDNNSLTILACTNEKELIFSDDDWVAYGMLCTPVSVDAFFSGNKIIIADLLTSTVKYVDVIIILNGNMYAVRCFV